MKTNAIQSNENSFSTIMKTSAIGGVAGYAAKYMLPLTSDEMDDEFKGAIEIIRKESNKAKAKSIETLRNIPDKTLAQDTFIKMVDAENVTIDNKDAARRFNARKIKKAIDTSSLNASEKAEVLNNLKTLKNQPKNAQLAVIDAIKAKTTKSQVENVILDIVNVDEKGFKRFSSEIINGRRAFKMKKIFEEAKLTDTDKVQLKSIMSNVNEKAANMFKRCTSAYEGAVKKNRQTGMFVAAGIAAGFIAGLTHNILKTDA